MRFIDFIEDIRDCSARIDRRRAFLDANLGADLTIKTLMRTDFIEYFDDLLNLSQSKLNDTQRLIFYLLAYAYIVNSKPRATNSELETFAGEIVKKLSPVDFLSETDVTLCKSFSIPLPKSIAQRLSSVLMLRQQHGLFAHFANKAPTLRQLNELCAPASKDAALLLYSGNENSSPPGFEDGDRLVYAGPIFRSKPFYLYGVYVGSVL